jgi:eukaryotic-like serine/threonine-protein kinase
LVGFFIPEDHLRTTEIGCQAPSMGQQLTMTDESRLGTRLGSYALKEIIGRGGMGVVYRATHIYIRKPAAVKVLHRHLFSLPGVKERFLREAQTASLVDHPNIVGVTDFGEAPDGTVYLVMSEAYGMGLDLVLEQEGTLPLFRAIGIVGQIAQALAAIHACNIVHQDVKPENIMLAKRSGRRELSRRLRDGDAIAERIEPEECFDLVTLLDFGAARMLQPGFHSIDDHACIFGTPAYLAPETAYDGHAEARSDIYSVGVMFYEMLTGQVPFDDQDPAEVMKKQIEEPPVPPRKRNPYVEITPEAEKLILRALEKRPERRQSSMEELWTELQKCYGSLRWYRPDAALDRSLEIERLRAPVQLHPPRLRRENKPTPAAAKPPLPPHAGPVEPSPPLLLTKRKSSKRFAVASPEEIPTPPPIHPAALRGVSKPR